MIDKPHTWWWFGMIKPLWIFKLLHRYLLTGETECTFLNIIQSGRDCLHKLVHTEPPSPPPPPIPQPNKKMITCLHGNSAFHICWRFTSCILPQLSKLKIISDSHLFHRLTWIAQSVVHLWFTATQLIPYSIYSHLNLHDKWQCTGNLQ